MGSHCLSSTGMFKGGKAAPFFQNKMEDHFDRFLRKTVNHFKKQIILGIAILFLMTNHFLVLNIGSYSKSGNSKFVGFFHKCQMLSFCVSNLRWYNDMEYNFPSETI